MKLPPAKKIFREDLKGAPQWIDPMINTINSFMESVYQGLNSNITFGDNVRSFIKEIDYVTSSSYPSGMEILEFPNTLKVRPTGVLTAQVVEKSTNEPPPGPTTVQWALNTAGNIEIHSVSGLEASKTYLVRLIVI